MAIALAVAQPHPKIIRHPGDGGFRCLAHFRPVSLTELTAFQKRIQGVMFGGCNPVPDIPQQILLYRAGRLKIDELVTAEYTLDQIAKGYDDLRAGTILRGIIRFPLGDI